MTVTRRTFLTGAMLTAAGCAGAGRPGSPGPTAADPYRLPSTVVPTRYEIRIAPDLNGSRFTGEETIEVTVREPVSEIVLNAVELEIHAARVRDGRGRALGGRISLEEATQRVRIRFGEMLSPGVWRLALSFGGVLNQRLHGFYRSRASLPDGSETVLAITQFQSTDARRAFPCWDEPAFKAVFEVTLVVDERLTALSNAAVIGEQAIPGTGTKAVRFAPTIPLSTYLVAFVVGDLEASPPRMVEGVPLRGWSLRGRTHLTRLGLDVGAFTLRFFSEYYGVPYPGDKLDLIAVPDFEAGGMENFGAVLFRETNLLLDERRAALGELRSVADNVSHEIAHMWFGDLVTMAWWNGLWLNEAFATFMQLLAVDAWRPAWERWVAFSIARAAALEVDALASTRPVEFAVRTPAEAEAMFDVLTYQKGAAILRMLERHLGTDAFRRGVHAYLTRHRLANAETRDLWMALGEASGQPIAEMMDRWVFHPGYPLVSVATEAGGRTLVFSQRRFAYQASRQAPDVWHIPVHVRVRLPDGARSLRLLLSAPEARLQLPAPAEWVVVNENADGFYRTRYAPDLLGRLAGDLFGRLSPVERFGLVSDTWAEALAGLVPVAEYLDLTGRLRGERDRNVWAAMIDAFAYLERVVAERDRLALARLVRDRLGPAAATLGWSPGPGEGEMRRELRADLLRALGTLGDDGAVHTAARELYRQHREDPAAVDPSMVAAAIAVRAHAGTEAEYREFSERFRSAPTPQDARRYLFSLARFREPELIQRTLHLTIGGKVRTGDAPYLVRSLLMSVAAREAAWRFVRKNWDTIRRAYTVSGLAILCEGLTGLTTPELEASVREFASSRGITLGGKTLDQYLERLRIAVAFREREAAALRAYLSRQ